MNFATIIAALALFVATRAHPARSVKATDLSYQCQAFSIQIPVTNITTLVSPFPEPQDQYQAVSIVNAITTRLSQAASGSPTFANVTATYNISAEYCQPKTASSQPVKLQILSHGIGFNRSYWNFRPSGNSSDSQYDYIAAATSAGYHTLSYNRIGINGSTIADPITEVQPSVQVAVLAGLTTLARAGKLPNQPSVPVNTIHVGHSFGSQLLVGLAAIAPTLSDGLVLTSDSNLEQYEIQFLIATNGLIANVADPMHFPNSTYSNGWWTWPSQYANQYAFFAYPQFDPTVLAQAEATKQPFSLGEIVGQAILPTMAPNFTAPVYFVNGEKDLIFCGSNCTGLIGPGSPAFQAFNGSSSVQSTIVEGFGHAMNLHLNASGKVYTPINNWLKSQGL